MPEINAAGQQQALADGWTQAEIDEYNRLEREKDQQALMSSFVNDDMSLVDSRFEGQTGVMTSEGRQQALADGHSREDISAFVFGQAEQAVGRNPLILTLPDLARTQAQMAAAGATPGLEGENLPPALRAVEGATIEDNLFDRGTKTLAAFEENYFGTFMGGAGRLVEAMTNPIEAVSIARDILDTPKPEFDIDALHPAAKGVALAVGMGNPNVIPDIMRAFQGLSKGVEDEVIIPAWLTPENEGAVTRGQITMLYDQTFEDESWYTHLGYGLLTTLPEMIPSAVGGLATRAVARGFSHMADDAFDAAFRSLSFDSINGTSFAIGEGIAGNPLAREAYLEAADELAKVLNVPVPIFHGTARQSATLENLKFRTARGNERGLQFDLGKHFTTDNGYAVSYGDNVIVAELNANRVFDAHQIVREGSAEYALLERLMKKGRKRFMTQEDFDTEIKSAYTGQIDNLSPKTLQKYMEAEGFDAIRYNARTSTVIGATRYLTGESADSVVVWGKNAIRPVSAQGTATDVLDEIQWHALTDVGNSFDEELRVLKVAFMRESRGKGLPQRNLLGEVTVGERPANVLPTPTRADPALAGLEVPKMNPLQAETAWDSLLERMGAINPRFLDHRSSPQAVTETLEQTEVLKNLGQQPLPFPPTGQARPTTRLTDPVLDAYERLLSRTNAKYQGTRNEVMKSIDTAKARIGKTDPSFDPKKVAYDVLDDADDVVKVAREAARDAGESVSKKPTALSSAETTVAREGNVAAGQLDSAAGVKITLREASVPSQLAKSGKKNWIRTWTLNSLKEVISETASQRSLKPVLDYVSRWRPIAMLRNAGASAQFDAAWTQVKLLYPENIRKILDKIPRILERSSSSVQHQYGQIYGITSRLNREILRVARSQGIEVEQIGKMLTDVRIKKLAVDQHILDPQLRKAYTDATGFLDDLSIRMETEGFFTPAELKEFTEGSEAYMGLAYQAFVNPKAWRKTVHNDGSFFRAIKSVMDNNPTITREEAEGMLNSLVAPSQRKTSGPGRPRTIEEMAGHRAGEGLETLNLGRLKQRTLKDKEVKKYLGMIEEFDKALPHVLRDMVFDIEHLAANRAVRDALIEAGAARGKNTKQAARLSLKHGTEVGTVDEFHTFAWSFDPLDKDIYYIRESMRDALQAREVARNEVQETASLIESIKTFNFKTAKVGDFGLIWRRFAGGVREMKTALSVTTAMRNLLSVPVMLMQFGPRALRASNRKHLVTAMGHLKNRTFGKDFLTNPDVIRASELGVLTPGSEIGEVLDLVGSANRGLYGKAVRPARHFYQGTDEAAKLFIFLSQRDDFARRLTSVDAPWLEAVANGLKGPIHEIKQLRVGIDETSFKRVIEEASAEITKNGYQNYNRVSSLSRWLSRHGAAGFTSFPMEIARTTAWNVRYGVQMWRYGKATGNASMKRAGAGTLAGVAASGVAAEGLATKSWMSNDMGSKERDALNRLSNRPWEKTSAIYMIDHGKGSSTYSDLGFLNPYGAFSEPVRALMNGDNWVEDADNLVGWIEEKFLSGDVAVQAVAEATVGELDDRPLTSLLTSLSPLDKKSGFQRERGLAERAGGLAVNLGPGTVPTVQRIIRKATDPEAGVKELIGAVLNVFGIPIVTTVKHSDQLRKVMFGRDQERSKLSARAKDISEMDSPAMRYEAKAKLAEDWAALEEEMIKDVEAARTLGVDRRGIDSAFKKKGGSSIFNQTLRDNLAYGRVTRIEDVFRSLR